MNTRILTTAILAFALAAALIVAACSGDDGSDAPATTAPTVAPAPATPAPTPAAPAATPMSTPEPTPASAANVDVGHEIGQVGADFTVTSVDGEEINLYSLRGSPVVLYYFATW